MATCKRCGRKPARWMSDMCGECINLTDRELNPDSVSPDESSPPADSNAQASSPPPALTSVFRFVATLQVIGGVVLCLQLWPAERAAGSWPTLAYVPAITWLMAGVVFGCQFLAVGEALLYLRDIRARLNSAVFSARVVNERSPGPDDSKLAG